ncbi:MAG: GH39 family glycosyl hydrolase [Phycisphaerae bacterium]
MKSLHPKLANYVLPLAILSYTAITFAVSVANAAPTSVSVTWSKTIGISPTTPTLQVVVNPLLRPGSPISHRAFQALHRLKANDVRFVPWLPYPQLAVAELKPPVNGKTFWNCKLIDPMVQDFMRATSGHPVIMNFSTIPEWMFQTPKPVTWPKNPDQVVWNYEQGTKLRVSVKTLANYYARLVSWYTRGGFRDEYGHWHKSPYHYHFAWWEVLNEVDFEHHMNVQEYTRWYDAITAAIHKVSPQTKFVGLALAAPSNDLPWFKYFLNPRNHKPGAPLQMISYHFYATPSAANKPKAWPKIFFSQAKGFLKTVRTIQAIREKLSPQTKTDIDEIGSILPYDTVPKLVRPIPNMYWNLSGAMYAYLFAHLASQGIQIAGESQLIGYPSQFPSVSMVNWTTGVPNARFRVLELLHDNFGPGDRIIATHSHTPGVFAQGFVTPAGVRKLLLVNKRNHTVELNVAAANGAVEQWVDQQTAEKPPAQRTLAHNHLQLGGLGVAVLTLRKP